MPAYSTSPFAQTPALLLPGSSGYSFGSFSDRVPSTKLFVLTSAVLSNVATITAQIWEGPLPTTSQFISTQGLARIPNVTNVAIASVAQNATTGVVTITFADAHSGTVASGADHALCIVPQIEVPEVVSATGAGSAFAVPNYGARQNEGRSITAIVSFVSLPTTAVVTLQGAVKNQDSEYADLGTVASVTTGAQAGGSLTVEDVNYEFYRLNIGTLTGGTSPSLIGKILV